MPDPNPSSSTKGDKKRVTLALQGGGAHGAFTWGVLDRLAEEPRLDIQAISGTSAGALNAAVSLPVLHKTGPRARSKNWTSSGATSPTSAIACSIRSAT